MDNQTANENNSLLLGYKAAKEGRGIRSCPFPHNSNDAYFWRRGYCDYLCGN